MIIAAAILYAFVGHVALTLSKDAVNEFSRSAIAFFVVLWPLGLVLLIVARLHERWSDPGVS